MNDKSFASPQEIYDFEAALINCYKSVISVRLAAITISIEMSNADLYRAAIADNDYEIVRLLTSMVTEIERDLDKLTAKTDGSMSIRQYSDMTRDIAHVQLRHKQLKDMLEKAEANIKTAASTMTTSYLIALKKFTSEIDAEKKSVSTDG